MTKTLMLPAAALAALFAFAGASPADASCRGKPTIALSDGSQACVLTVTTTELTKTTSVKGAGPATARTNKSEGGVVSLLMLNEPSAKATTKNVIRRRARAVCEKFKPEILGLVKKPSDILMVVVFGWGDAPYKPRTGLSSTYRELYLNRNCRVKVSK